MKWVHKVKRPGGVCSFGVVPLVTDEHGDWASAPIGAPWHAPHDAGVLDVTAIFLAPHVQRDIARPASWVVEGWRRSRCAPVA